MTLLGIDPGTSCGWAVVASDGVRLAGGTWDLQPRRHEGGGMRYVRLRRYLTDILEAWPTISVVAYEEVRRHAGTDAAHIYGGIVGVISQVCEEREIAYHGVPVPAVKRRATGKGNAGKAEMIEAFAAYVGADAGTDDEADALFVALVGLESV